MKTAKAANQRKRKKLITERGTMQYRIGVFKYELVKLRCLSEVEENW